jgi:glycosyltransferase involved in cell wall biosynthesis
VTLPAVSVVIATRDRPDMLRRAVEAVLAQDYDGQVECIVVYDQSDPDLSLTRDSGDRRVVVVGNDRAPGLAGARNCGVAAATGELIGLCDDDDVWLPEKLHLQVDALAGTGAGLAVCGIVIEYRGALTERIPVQEELTVSHLLRRRVMEAHPSTVLVSRAAWDEIGGVDEAIPGSYGEDYDWMLRALGTTEAVVVPRALVRVLWGAQSYYAQRWETIIAAIDYGLTKHPEFATEPRGLARLYGRRSFALAALGRRGEARRWAVRTFRTSWREPRSYLALLVSSHLLSADRAMRLANRAGRGI